MRVLFCKKESTHRKAFILHTLTTCLFYSAKWNIHILNTVFAGFFGCRLDSAVLRWLSLLIRRRANCWVTNSLHPPFNPPKPARPRWIFYFTHMETTIHKCSKSRHYTKISNAVLQDDRLTLKEIGLMSYILSLPDSWVLCIAHLNGRYGRSTVSAALANLKELGYMHHGVERDLKTNKIIAHRWTAYDDPAENTHKQVFQSVAFPDAGKSTAIKETGKRKEIAKRETLCTFPEPKVHELPSIESLEDQFPDIEFRFLETALCQAETDLAKGKRINSPAAYIAGLARKIEEDMPTKR